jgi:hypothetical protein
MHDEPRKGSKQRERDTLSSVKRFVTMLTVGCFTKTPEKCHQNKKKSPEQKNQKKS